MPVEQWDVSGPRQMRKAKTRGGKSVLVQDGGLHCVTVRCSCGETLLTAVNGTAAGWRKAAGRGHRQTCGACGEETSLRPHRDNPRGLYAKHRNKAAASTARGARGEARRKARGGKCHGKLAEPTEMELLREELEALRREVRLQSEPKEE